LANDPEAKRFKPVCFPRPVAMAVVLVLAVLGGRVVAGCFGPAIGQLHWDRYLVLESAFTRLAEPRRNAGKTADAQANSERDRELLASTTQMIGELEQVVRWDPDHARAHLRLAQACLRHFDLLQQSAENAMPLEQVCDAVVSGNFKSHEEVDRWLSQVLGPRRSDLDMARMHARLALSLAPTQGEGYLYLSQLCFLDGPTGVQARPGLVTQALTVRPYDGTVLFEAGKEALLAGDMERALKHWRKSFHNSRLHRMQLIEMLAGRLPIGVFIESFQPDLDALRRLHGWYAALENPAQKDRLCETYRQQALVDPQGREESVAAADWLHGELAELRRSYLQAAEAETTRLSGVKAASIWLEIASVHHQMGDAVKELEFTEKALRLDPSNYQAHGAAGRCLAAAGRFTDAESHLAWCLERQPKDTGLQTLLRETVKKRIDLEGRTVGAGHTPEILR
jgi:tetratricopeptide (TPR) repeat protein